MDKLIANPEWQIFVPLIWKILTFICLFIVVVIILVSLKGIFLWEYWGVHEIEEKGEFEFYLPTLSDFRLVSSSNNNMLDKLESIDWKIGGIICINIYLFIILILQTKNSYIFIYCPN